MLIIQYKHRVLAYLKLSSIYTIKVVSTLGAISRPEVSPCVTAVLCWLGLLSSASGTTVNFIRISTGVGSILELIVEQKTIGAQLLSSYTIFALDVFVALFTVCKESQIAVVLGVRGAGLAPSGSDDRGYDEGSTHDVGVFGSAVVEELQNAAYPCGYPNEVDCGARGKTQQPQPTENCGNAYGYFGSGDVSQCGYYFNCVDGREFKFSCPAGLAWSEITYNCEYPNESPNCDTRAYLGFECPAVRDAQQVALFGHPRLASPRDCRQYFICVEQSPRLNNCENGLVFNQDAFGCDEPENVRGCETYYPREELAAIRERKAVLAEAAARRAADFAERRAQLAQRRSAGQL